MWKRYIISGFCLIFLFILSISPVCSQSSPEISLPGNDYIISYLPYKIVWSYPDSFDIYQQFIRISQDPFGDAIHLQRILPDKDRDFILRHGLADNQGYYVSAGCLANPDASVLWSPPVYFILDHLNSPPGKFMIKTLPDTLSPGVPLRWTASSDPDPLDTLLRYIIFAENLRDSSVQHEIPYLPEQRGIKEHFFDLTPYLKNHKTYKIHIFAEDLESVLREGSPEQTIVYNTGKNRAPVSPAGLTPFEISELMPGERLSWESVYDADNDPVSYQVQIDTTPVFSNPLSLTTSRANYVLSKALEEYFNDDTHLYWRVRAMDMWGGISSWSTFGSFYINFMNTPPYWISDINRIQDPLMVTHHEYMLSWPKAADDDYTDQDSLTYHIWYRSNDDPTRHHYRERKPQQIIPVDDLQENVSYDYIIKAEDQAGHYSRQSLTGKITVNNIDEPPYIPPEIAYPPKDKILSPTGRLAWKVSRDRDPWDTLMYVLMISSDSTFQKSVFSEHISQSKLPVHAHLLAGFKRWDSTPSLFYTNNPDTIIVQMNYLNFWNRLKDNQKYFFKIQAIDKKLLSSDFSPVHSFILNKRNNSPETVHEIYFPHHMSNINTTKPVFHWKASDDPDPDGDTSTTRYQMNIRDIDKRETEYILTSPGVSQTVPSYPFRENGRYELKIRSFDEKSAFSEWSASVYFWINETPELPKLQPGEFSIQPDSIISKPDPVFHFGSARSPDPPEDQKEYYMDVRFIFPSTEDTITYESLPFEPQFRDSTLSFPENTRGSYQIRLKSDTRQLSHWTEPISFGIDMYADIPLPFYLIRPKAGQDTVKVNPTFKWTACIDPDLDDNITYTLYISPDSTFYQDTYIIRDIQGTRYILDDYDLDDNTKYFWKVSAEDKDGHVVWGSNSNFQKRHFIVGLLEEAENDQQGGNSHEFHPVQPNPFKNIVTLKFTLGQSEEVTISIYNIIGQRIEIIRHGVFAAGTHSIKWDITQAGVPLPAGVYIFT